VHAPPPGVERTDDQLGAEFACQELINCYALHIDSRVARKNVDLFTEDAEAASPKQAVKGRSGLESVMAAREADIERKTRHQVSNIVFCRTGPDSATAQSLMCLYVLGDDEELSVRAITVFDDEFARDGVGRWRFSRRFATPLAGGR
jgi:SnoaL-like domain